MKTWLISLIDKMRQAVLSPNHSLLETFENVTQAKPCVFLIKIYKITTRTTWVKSHCSLFKVFKRCARKKKNKSWIQLFQPLKKTVFERNIVLASPHLDFWKSDECWILKDVMVQFRTIRYTVFRWTIRFGGTIQVGTAFHLWHGTSSRYKWHTFTNVRYKTIKMSWIRC